MREKGKPLEKVGRKITGPYVWAAGLPLSYSKGVREFFCSKNLKGGIYMKQTEHVKVLVVGDIMLDKYVVGDVTRLSPEAPVPVVHVRNEYYTLGGCGNVVRNLRELGAEVDCMASTSLDRDGEIVRDELDRIGAKDLCCYDMQQTIIKERIIADERKVQMLRIDRERNEPINADKAIEAFERLSRNNYDIVVVSDYAKGMISKELMQYLKENVKADIIVDPKPINGFLYDDVFMITPNEKEWGVMELSSQYALKQVKYVLETKGKEGMILHDRVRSQDWPITASDPVEVYNVSGAGDTVVAVMALCISMGIAPITSAAIANRCASYVVTLPGTSTVPRSIFDTALENILRG